MPCSSRRSVPCSYSARSVSRMKYGLPPVAAARRALKRGAGCCMRKARRTSSATSASSSPCSSTRRMQPAAVELQQGIPDRRAGGQLLGAPAEDQQHARAAQGRQQRGQRIERRAVEPVQILQDQHLRRDLAQRQQHGGERGMQRGHRLFAGIVQPKRLRRAAARSARAAAAAAYQACARAAARPAGARVWE